MNHDLDTAGGVLRHSGLGIGALVIGLVAIVGLVVTFVCVAAIMASTGHISDPSSPVAILVGLAIVICMLAALIGVVIGLVGMFQRDRKKVFAHIGFGINVAIVVVVIAIIALGIAANHAAHP